MALNATPQAPDDADTETELAAAVGAATLAARAESASESAANRPQASGESRAEQETTEPSTSLPSGGAGSQEEEKPEQAGERLASHLDMLAETVRAIVTRVMQPSGDADDSAITTTAVAPATVPAATTAASGRSEYSLEVREQCVRRHAAGASYKTIGIEMGMPTTTVQTIVKRAKQQGGVVTAAQRAGRPRVTDDAVEQTIREIVTRQPQLSAREVLDQVMLSHEGIAVSFETIRRRVRSCRKELNGDATGTTTPALAPAAPAPLTFQQQLRAGLQQQQAQLSEMDDPDTMDMDDDMNSDKNDTDYHRDVGDLDSAGSDTEPETSTGTAVSTTDTSKPASAAGTAQKKTRRKRGSEYSPEFRELCVVKHERDGKSYQAIATELDIPPDSVRAIVRKAKRTGSVVTAPRSGRPRKTTDLIDRVILQSVKNSQRSTAKQIQDDLWSIYQVKVSCETIRRRVRDHTKQRLQVADATAVSSTVQDVAQALQPSAALSSSASASFPAVVTAPPRVDAEERTSAESSSGSPAATTPPSVIEAISSNPPKLPATATRSLKRKRTEYPVDVREKCVSLHGQGLGFRKIGEQLNMPHTTVRAIVEKVQRTGSMLPAPRSGRPRKTDEILDKVILQTVKANAKCSARMIQQELETAFDVKVSCETIRRRVKDYMRQKHLFAEASSPLAMVVSEEEGDEDEEATVGDRVAQANPRRRAAPAQVPVPPVHIQMQDAASSMQIAEQLEIHRRQQQQQQEREQEQQRRLQEQQQAQQQEQEQRESMLLMAEITQPFHNNVVHPQDVMVASAGDVRSVPPSLMEMMTAAAAAAAAVSNHHQHQHQLQHHQLQQVQQHQQQMQQQHLAYQAAPPHQLPLMPMPYGFGFAHQLHGQPHAQAMQAMLDEALAATQPIEPAPHNPHSHHQHHLHPLQPQPQAPQPTPPHQPSAMSEFVL